MFSNFHLAEAAKKALLAAAIGLALWGAAPAGSAFAGCSTFVATESDGYGNTYIVDAWGCPYVSGAQHGVRHMGSVVAKGTSRVATYQSGRMNEANTDVAGDSDIGIVQRGNRARADVYVRGNGNGAAVYQDGNNSTVQLTSVGNGNQVKVHTHQ